MPEVGEAAKIIGVSNTGPLISALQCGRMDLLKHYFSVLYIAASEHRELKYHGWGDDIQGLIEEGFVIVVRAFTEQDRRYAEDLVQRIAAVLTPSDPDWSNHLLEAEAMVLAERHTHLMADQILLDEKAARSIAHELGLSVTGLPGVLGRAGLDGLVTMDEIREL